LNVSHAINAIRQVRIFSVLRDEKKHRAGACPPDLVRAEAPATKEKTQGVRDRARSRG
jgi:hypothetical protein